MKNIEQQQGESKMTYATKKELLNTDAWITRDVVSGYQKTEEKFLYVEDLAYELLEDDAWKYDICPDHQGRHQDERDHVVEKMENKIEDILGMIEEENGRAASERNAEDAWLQDAEYDPEHWAVGGDAYRD